ncbi:NAD(P)-dependent oxidoreductase [Nocardioides aurantiacus]|uniref:Putative NADH-flavin reductase n=1 Tax=Nocardioides aurantiacus TaxID=86796 RepID=A0A3N2CUV4_9ACTN|nr:NAD(P)H-binding protein [Nocardioides aurantiacus]ROR91004.1 putative NADH-flavin reductase [Nocardioides aurantiacus]
MHLAVFGANGPTGRLVVLQALAAGHRVTAVTRKPDHYPIRDRKLVVLAADVTDVDGVGAVLDTQPEAVISTYGVPFSRKPITVYSAGITHILGAMVSSHVERLVCVTSTTLSTEKPPPGASLFGTKVLEPLLRNVLGRTLYDDMERMESLVRASTVNWTIVRPGGLFNLSEPTDDYEISMRRLPGNRVTSRADLAEALILEATTPRHPRSVIEIITRSSTPSPGSFFREAFGKS